MPNDPTATPTELHWLTIADAARLIETRRLSPVELTDALLARIEALDPQLNAFLLPTPEKAREQAKADGFEAFSIAEATKKADMLLIELADPVQPPIYKKDIGPNLRQIAVTIRYSGIGAVGSRQRTYTLVTYISSFS